MNSQEIVDYVMKTPHNTNPAILKQKIEEISGASSWNDLKDKPFGEEQAFEPIVYPDMLDVATSYDVSDLVGINNFILYKVTNVDIPAEDAYIGATVKLVGISLFEKNSYEITKEDSAFTGVEQYYIRFEYETGDFLGTIGIFVVHDESAGFPIGVYMSDMITSNSSSGQANRFPMGFLTLTKETIKPLDEKYLPDSAKGGGGCKTLVLTATDETLNNITANMTLAEAIEAIKQFKISNVLLFYPTELTGGFPTFIPMGAWCDASAALGADCIFLMTEVNGITLFWTSAGFSTTPPGE